MSLALVAIVLDEVDYIDRWSQVLSTGFDEVVVVDGGSRDGTLEKLRAMPGVKLVERSFAGHFADQRNYGIEQCSSEWVFEMDADEIASAPLLGGLRAICTDADRGNADCVGIPRLNFIDGRLVEGPGHMGLDFQYRLHRRSCHWRGAVHEEVTGYRARYELKLSDGHFLVHDKTSARHLTRNGYYRTIAP